MLSIENKIFTWQMWDSCGELCAVFYNCQLVKDFGPFKEGEKFDLILIDYQESFIEFWKKEPDENDNTPGDKFEIELSIVKKISE